MRLQRIRYTSTLSDAFAGFSCPRFFFVDYSFVKLLVDSVGVEPTAGRLQGVPVPRKHRPLLLSRGRLRSRTPGFYTPSGFKPDCQPTSGTFHVPNYSLNILRCPTSCTQFISPTNNSFLQDMVCNMRCNRTIWLEHVSETLALHKSNCLLDAY